MIRLILNENMKLYRRLRSWVMMGILILLVAGGCVLDLIDQDSVDDWRKSEQAAVDLLKGTLEKPNLSDKERIQLEKELMISQYRLEHNIPHYEDATLWGTVSKSSFFIGLVTVFAVIMAAEIVASEFSWGTIKLLLIRPASRLQILLSKYLAVLLYAVVLLAIVFVSSMLLGGLLFGFEGAKVPHLVIKDGSVVEMYSVLYLLQLYALKSVNLLMLVSFAFMISTVYRSSTMAITLSLLMLFAGDIIVLSFSHHEWVKYLLFANVDLIQYINGTPLIEGMTLTFSIIVLGVYFLFFNLCSCLVFTRRDVAN